MKNFLLNSGILFALIGCNTSMDKVLPMNPSDINQTVKKEASTIVVPSDINQTVKKEASTIVVPSDINQTVKKEASTVVVPSDINQTVKKEASTIVVPSDINQTVKKEASTVVVPLDINQKDTPMILSNGEKIKALYEKSISLIKNEDYGNAYKTLEEISDLCTTDNKESLSMCAKSFYNKGIIEENKNKSATASYEQSLQYDFKDKNKIFQKLAYIYYNESSFEQALPYLLKFKNVNDVRINYMIGISYINLNKKSLAKEFILKAKNLGDKNAENIWFKYELYGY